MNNKLLAGLAAACAAFITCGLLVGAAVTGGTGGQVVAAGPNICVQPVAAETLPASQARDRNWGVVIQRGVAKGVPARGIQVAIAVTIVESTGLNYASRRVPESLGYPNDGVVPGDHLSINLFQQQVGMGWFDTVANGMRVPVAADSFYDHLLAVDGWQSMPFGAAAQAVQRSAFPSRYAKHEGEAAAIYRRLGGSVIVPAADTTANPGAGCLQETPGGPATVSGRWANPLKPAAYVLTSPMGWRNLNGVPNYHKGQDLGVPVGTPVRSICDGVAVRAEWDTFGGGYQVNIDCGGDVLVKLMHNSTFAIKKGDPVTAGEVVAYSGSTGNSTGPHSHVQIEFKGEPTDPVPFLQQRGVPL